jgi:hypothetical protein
MSSMWQKFHVLNRSQVFVVACVCAAVIAFSGALASIPADGVSWNRFLRPSRQLDPLINFGSTFVSVLPVLLGYYWLARLGALLGVAVSALAFFATQLCADFIFAFRLVGRPVAAQETAYAGVCLLLGALFLWAHLRMPGSSVVRDAQRMLLLTDSIGR